MIHVSSEDLIPFSFDLTDFYLLLCVNFLFSLIFLDIWCRVRFGYGDFGYFPHHLDLVGASSNALRNVHLKVGW
jgi:hypothetical protein